MSNALENARLERAVSLWPVVRLKHVAQLSGGGTPSKENEAFWSNGTVPWASPKDMKRRVILETEDYITEAAVASSATSYVEPGTPLLVARSGILRHTLPIAIAGRRLTINQDMKAFRLSERVINRFFVYWIEGQSHELLLEWRQFGATVESIDTIRMMNGRIALPDPPTQAAIADFLDRETARIDQLIERKERLIEVAILRQATRLDEATFRSGDLAGWTRVPFKWCCRIPTGQIDPKDEPWSQWPLIAPNHIESGTGRILNVESAIEQGAESGKYLYPAGTVLYTEIRPALAKACIAPEQGLCSADMYPITPSQSLLPGFLLMQLLSRTFTDWAVMESMRVAMPKVNRETLGRFPLILAPIGRQHELVDDWFAEVGQTRVLVDKIRLSIEGLNELRSALITAAVTGQIDVATWGKQGETDRRLEVIERVLEAQREEAAV